MFKPVLSAAKPLRTPQPVFRPRHFYWALAVLAGVALLVIVANTDGLFRWRSTRGDLTQQVAGTIQHVNQATGTIRVVGDLVGIMGADVVVAPQTFIGI